MLHCCRSWSPQAWKLLGNVHLCPSQCPICAQHLYKLGHSLYTGATAWSLLVHWRCIHAWARVHFQAVSKLGHSNFYSSVSCLYYKIYANFVIVSFCKNVQSTSNSKHSMLAVGIEVMMSLDCYVEQ